MNTQSINIAHMNPSASKERRLVAANIEKLLKERGTTKAAVAKAAGLAKGTLTFITQCDRDPSVDTLAKLAKGLGVKPWQLLHPTAYHAPEIERLIDNYTRASASAREYIDQIAEYEASKSD